HGHCRRLPGPGRRPGWGDHRRTDTDRRPELRHRRRSLGRHQDDRGHRRGPPAPRRLPRPRLRPHPLPVPRVRPDATTTLPDRSPRGADQPGRAPLQPGGHLQRDQGERDDRHPSGRTGRLRRLAAESEHRELHHPQHRPVGLRDPGAEPSDPVLRRGADTRGRPVTHERPRSGEGGVGSQRPRRNLHRNVGPLTPSRNRDPLHLDTVGRMIDFKQLIGGEWVGAANGGTWDLVNPATEEVIETLPFGDAADLVAAVEAAHGAFREWSHLTAYQRSKVLLKAADIILENIDEFARITTEESGKPFAQSKGEWLGAPNQLRWAAGEAERLYGRWIPSRMPGRRIDVIYQPIGV